MEVKQLSRVVSSTGKIHQNQEVWSLRGAMHSQSHSLQKRSESVGEK